MAGSNIYITAFENQKTFKDAVNIDSAKKYQIDYSPWAEENNNVTTVTWTVQSGNASVSAEALSSNVASALITFSSAGRNLIQVKADTGTEIFVTYLNIYVRDPEYDFTNDYGFGI